jgi:hypothetical protein
MGKLGGIDTFSLSYDDLETVTEAASIRLPPGRGEADRVAHVKKLCEATAELGYALHTYSHRVLLQTRRPRPDDDLLAETVALQDALNAFGVEIRSIADAFRRLMPVEASLEQVDQ